jgi:uncharacterized membrane protein YfcA
VDLWLYAPIFAIVLLAFFTESVVGFGATVITVSLGAHLVGLDTLLPAFVPLSALLSAILVARHHTHVDLPFLWRRVALPVGFGTLLGMGIYRVLDSTQLLTVFAGFVLIVATRELWRAVRKSGDLPPLNLGIGAALLTGGGVIHGMFGSGGPMIVYVLGREITQKSRFRATLSAMWLVLNIVLVIGYLRDGMVDRESLALSGVMAPALFFGIILGERVHGQIPESTFRVVTWVVLLIGASTLLIRAISG